MGRIVGKAPYTTKTKYEAVVLYRMVGNMRIVSLNTGVPYATLKDWKGQDWWFEIEEELRKEGTHKLNASLQTIVDKALVEVQDRLVNGDWIWDQKMGQMVRKPIGAHTANQILKDGLDRTFLIEKIRKDEKKNINEEKITERLLKLAQEFEKYAKAKEIPGELITEGHLHAIHDEREAGLREGEPAIQIQAGTNSQTGSSQ